MFFKLIQAEKDPTHTHTHTRPRVCVLLHCRRAALICEQLPVQPGQQILGSCNELDNGAQELVGGLMGNLVVVGGILPALRHGGAQAVVRCSHIPHDGLQVVGLHAVVLWKRPALSKTTLPIRPVSRAQTE